MASDIERLQAAVARLVQVPDTVWTRAMSNARDSFEIEHLCKTAKEAAAAHWTALADGAPSLLNINPIAQIERYNVGIEEEAPGPLDKSFIHFAVFDPGRRTVEVSTSAVANVQSRIAETGIDGLLDAVSVMTVVLWHEYYHVWMREQAKHHQQPARMRLTQVLQSRGGARLEQQLLEELGAIWFSKLACGLSYHPQILQWLLVETENPEKAHHMLDHIVEKSVMK